MPKSDSGPPRSALVQIGEPASPLWKSWWRSIILSVGLLGMAGTTMLMVKQTTLADVTTERAAALRAP